MLTQINLKLSSLAIVMLLLVSSCSNNEDDSKAKNNTRIQTAQTTQTTGIITNRLNIVQNRGKLICGVNGQLPGFSFVDEDGQYSGMDVDICRAVAAAIFDYPGKVEFHELDIEKRFLAVQSGEVDLLSRNSTWTLSRDTSDGMEFTPTTFYDGQGILVKKDSDIKELEDLDGRSVCVLAGTTNEQNLADNMRKLGLNYAPVLLEDTNTLFADYEKGRCEAATSDRSQLIVRRAGLSKPDNHQVLEEIVLSKEPLGPVIADGDPKWFDVVKWVTYAMIEAEELGINSQNVGSYARTEDPEIRRFLGLEGNFGEEMGLPNDFAQRIVKHVGNYDEVYERNIGLPFDLERGQNALWTDGGLMYSPPFK
jgi:general L-amino acid transport system substrate-binding protein